MGYEAEGQTCASFPPVPGGGEPSPEEAVSGGQLGAPDRTLEDSDLVTQSEDLQLKRGTATKRGVEEGENGRKNGAGAQTTNERQLPIYQFDRSLREAQKSRDTGDRNSGNQPNLDSDSQTGGHCGPKITPCLPAKSLVSLSRDMPPTDRTYQNVYLRPNWIFLSPLLPVIRPKFGSDNVVIGSEKIV